MRGRNCRSYHSVPLARSPNVRVRKPASSGTPQEHEHALRDLPHRHVDTVGRQPQPARQHVEVEPAEERERDDLEHRVQRNQHRGQLAVAAREVVPDEHHRDAAGQAHDDQPRAVLGQIGQREPSEREHQGRAHQPVEHQRQAEHTPVGHHVAEARVLHLRQHRVHHQQQAERDRQAHGAHLHPVERVVEAGEQSAQQQPHHHRRADPHGQQAVECRQPPRRARFRSVVQPVSPLRRRSPTRLSRSRAAAADATPTAM